MGHSGPLFHLFLFFLDNKKFSLRQNSNVGVVGEHTDHTAQPKNYQIFSSQSTTIFLKVYLVLSSDIITNQVQHDCLGQSERKHCKQISFILQQFSSPEDIENPPTFSIPGMSKSTHWPALEI